MHNSFDILEENGTFTATSHNFKEFSGKGSTENAAIQAMENKIKYYSLNNSKNFIRRIKERLNAGLECGCGYKLESPVMAVVGAI